MEPETAIFLIGIVFGAVGMVLIQFICVWVILGPPWELSKREDDV